MIELLNHIGRLWWAWTASMFWQVGLLILLIGCIDLLTRKWAWPQLRYALWSLILVKLILPPTLSLPSGVVPELRPVVGRVVRWLDSEKPAGGEKPAAISDCGLRIADLTLNTSPQFSAMAVADIGFQSPIADQGATNVDSTLAANPQSEIINPQLEWQFYAMTIWLLGTLILGIWLFLRLHSVAGRQGYRAAAASLPQSFYNHLADCATRLGLRRIPRVAVTKRLTSPAVFGVFSPVLLVPKGYLSKLSRRDTEHLLLHELAHIKRGDLVMHGLYLLLQIVYWYNPLLWLVRRHMHHLRELSCDGTVAELLRERTLAYRQTLLETARRLLTTSVEPGLGLLGLFEDSNHLLVRLNWLMKPTWRYSTMKRVIVATIAVLMFACVLPMARGQEAASNEITKVSASEVVPVRTEEDNQQTQDQLSRDITKLQAQLEQLMAQQQELRKQLDTLRQRQQQPGLSNVESKREVASRVSREPFNMHKVKKGDTLASIAKKFYGPEQGSRPENIDRIAKENHLDSSGRLWTGQSLRIPVRWMMTEDEIADPTHERASAEPPVAPVPPAPPVKAPPVSREAPDREAREQVREVQRQVQRAQEESKQAIKEAARAQKEAEKGRAESHALHAQGQQDWAKSMQAYGDQMQKWSQSEEMQKWHQDMAKWGQQMGRWGQEFGNRQTGEGMNDAEQPPMPPMPAMPPRPAMSPMPPMPPISVHVPEIHMPAVESPAVDDKQDGREEAVSRLEQAVDLPAGRLLELANEIGSISVRGGDEPGCKIVATVKAKAETKEEAQRIVDQVKLIVTPSDEKIRVSLTKPENRDKQKGIGCQVALEVTVPRKVQIKASQAVGDIRLTNLRGSVDASAKVGSIRATDVSGRVALSADVGGVEFTAPKDFSAKVQAKANMGSIQSDLPLEVAKPRGVVMGSSATGTIGGGDGDLSLKTNVGSIRIRSQSAEPGRAERSRREPRPEPRPEPRSDKEF